MHASPAQQVPPCPQQEPLAHHASLPADPPPRAQRAHRARGVREHHDGEGHHRRAPEAHGPRGKDRAVAASEGARAAAAQA
eukprot:3401765-Alexandrium_andersonii.AAC.1